MEVVILALFLKVGGVMVGDAFLSALVPCEELKLV